MMTNFLKDQVYENVYMIFIDASGHSNIVRNNPKNLSSQGFDLLEETLVSRLNRTAANQKCEIASIWSWLGDGGMFAIYDSKEDCALNTAIKFAKDVLSIDLKTLQLEFNSLDINGELHLRIAIHKGTIKFKEEGQQGSIHSSDINWGAHLEKVTPADSIAVSKDIYDIMSSSWKKGFIAVGEFEERKIYINTPNSDNKSIIANWRSMQGFGGVEIIQCYNERISQENKAELINSAKVKVIDFGTTLNTCSGYLDSTARPVPYKKAVLELLKRGGEFCCYMLAPNSSGSEQLKNLRNEDTDAKLRKTEERFANFKEKNAPDTEKFHVFQMNGNPNLAAMFFDPDSEDAICIFSPYLNVSENSKNVLGRADMPHFLFSKKQSQMYNYIWNLVNSYIENAKCVI